MKALKGFAVVVLNPAGFKKIRSSELETRPTVAVIDTGALEFNYRQLAGLMPPGSGVMAVVKANAYGHGDVEASRVFESLGCDSLGVALAEEGIRLRKAGIKAPIVVLGGIYPGQVEDIFTYGLTPVLFDLELAALIDARAAGYGTAKKVHLKIDTGMCRLGVMPADIAGFIEAFKGLRHLELEGVMSHFAEAEAEDGEFSAGQLKVFLESVDFIRGAGLAPRLVDMANSAAAVGFEASRLSLVRCGIMLYGAYPSERFRPEIELRPAMQVKTRILCVKRVPPGTPVSYGRTFVTERESLIATLPIGYGDGLPRRLSNNGEVLVRGERAPVAGTVCMDLTMCDVTGIDGAAPGDEVVVLGRQGEDIITAEETAERLGTISYEIFCNISARVPRVYI